MVTLSLYIDIDSISVPYKFPFGHMLLKPLLLTSLTRCAVNHSVWINSYNQVFAFDFVKCLKIYETGFKPHGDIRKQGFRITWQDIVHQEFIIQNDFSLSKF